VPVVARALRKPEKWDVSDERVENASSGDAGFHETGRTRCASARERKAAKPDKARGIAKSGRNSQIIQTQGPALPSLRLGQGVIRHARQQVGGFGTREQFVPPPLRLDLSNCPFACPPFACPRLLGPKFLADRRWTHGKGRWASEFRARECLLGRKHASGWRQAVVRPRRRSVRSGGLVDSPPSQVLSCCSVASVLLTVVESR
jgi:hypothetical protein